MPGQQSQTSVGVEIIASLRVGLVVGWAWAFVMIDLIVIVKGMVSGWSGIRNREHHPNLWFDTAVLRLLRHVVLQLYLYLAG